MDEQRAWIRLRRKRRMRLLAVALCFCLSFTIYPDILETSALFEVEAQEKEDSLYISGFLELSEDIREQTVPIGTELGELVLPSALEAVTEQVGGDFPENEDDDAEDKKAGNTDAESEGTFVEEEECSEDKDDNAEESSEDGGESTEQTDTQESDVEEDIDTEDGEEQTEESMIEQETYTVTMPEYHVQNVISVQTIENMPDTKGQQKNAVIEGVTWQCEPEYDGDAEGAYTFTAVLPEGYTLAEGVSLPQIMVRVRGADTDSLTLPNRIAARADATHTHSDSNIAFKIWDQTNSLPTEAGNWYLGDDVTLTSNYLIPGDVNICLNGHMISGSVSNGMLRVYNHTLDIYDCSSAETGKIYCSGGNNPIQVSEYGVLNLYGGTVQSGSASAIPIGTGSNDSSGGTVNVYSGATVKGGTNGILVNANLSSTQVNIYGGSINGGGSGYSINMKNPNGNVTIQGNAEINPAIYTVTHIIANTTVSNTYTINYANVKERDTVVKGSTDRNHYKLPDGSSYVLVPYEGNLIAAKSEYTVTLNHNGGSGGTDLIKYVTGQGAELPADFTKTDYTFEGWYEKADLSGTKVVRISDTDFGDKTYYAKWAPESYTIIYHLNGGVVSGNPNPTAYTKESNTIRLTNPDRVGYTFAGWSGTGLSGEANKDVTIAAGSTGNREYTAHWTANTDTRYSVAYYWQNVNKNGYELHETILNTGTTGVTVTADEKNYAGFSCNLSHTGNITSGTIQADGSLTLKLYYDRNTYKVTLDSQNGTISSGNVTSYTYGQKIALPTDVSRKGYTFDGWYDNKDLTGTKVIEISASATGDKTFYAKWTAKKVTLTFDYQNATGGADTAVKKVSYNESYGELPLPERTGYNFKGWYTTADGMGSEIKNTTIVQKAEDHTIYALWKDETEPDMPVLQDNIDLPLNWTNTYDKIPLKLYDGVEVTELWVSIDSGAYMQVKEFPGGSTEYAYTVAEGEHVYRFKAKDAAGNESEESAAYKVMLDKTNPVIGALDYQNMAKNFLDWIIGKKSLIIHVPVIDEGSGVVKISYIMSPADTDSSMVTAGTAEIKGGKAKITFANDFKGIITISCTDTAGNAAGGVTIGTTGTGGVIAEDRAPQISILADRSTSDMAGTQPGGVELSENYYESVPAIIVTVKDDIENAVTAGIDAITYQIGDGVKQSVAVKKNALQAEITFTISDTEISAGTTAIKVTAVDNAGNEESKSITVKVKGPEEKPAAVINYYTERLNNLIPRAEYIINGIAGTADEEGCIPIDKDWFNTTVSIVKKGNGGNISDSSTQNLFIPQRPQKPIPVGTDVSTAGGTGKLTGLTANTSYEISIDRGKTWESRMADGNGAITGLTPAGYVVRAKAGASNFAGEQSDEIKIGACYTVTLQGGTGCNLSAEAHSTSPVKEGGSFTFKFMLDQNYEKTNGFAVKVNGIKVELAAGDIYIITDIRENKTVTVEGIRKKPSSAGEGSVGDSDKESDDAPLVGEEGDTPTDSTPTDSGDDKMPAGGKPTDGTNGKTPTGGKMTEETSGKLPTEGKNAEGTDRGPLPSADLTDGTDEEPPVDAKYPGEKDSTVIVPIFIEDGKIILSGGTAGKTSKELLEAESEMAAGECFATGNVEGMTTASTILQMSDGSGNSTGAVVVTVVCEEQTCTAGVADAVAVANAVLTPEYIQLVNDGKTTEIRIDVTDISESVSLQDKEVIEEGIGVYQKELAGLTLGMYIDISMFIKVGAGDWDAVIETKEPIDVVIGIAEELQSDGREYYIIRAHDGEYSFMSDKDDVPDTITISTDRFSSYAIAFEQIDGTEGNHKCRLCDICPTFFGICYFIWLAVIAAAVIIVIIILRGKGEERNGKSDKDA